MLGVYEGVCVCGHAQDEHPGPCDRCQDPPCAFFVLRFHREIVTLAPRWTGADPVGRYWRLMNPPRGSTAWVFAGLSLEDRSEVSSPCFQAAHFDSRGELSCIHPFRGVTPEQFREQPWLYFNRPSRIYPTCAEEYMCEVVAAFLLMPRGVDLVGKVDEVAARFDCEPWAVRFRRVLEVNLDPTISALLDFGDTYDVTRG